MKLPSVPFADFDPRTVPMSWTILSRFGKSAAHAKHAAWTGKTDAGTQAMKMGRGFHAVALNQPYSIFTGKQRRGKDWDRHVSEHIEEHGEGAPILNPREHALASAMAAAIRADYDAAPLIFGEGVRLEERIEWERGSRAMSSHVDFRKPGQWLGDLKGVKDGRPARYQQAGMWAGHHAQVCLYDEADAYDCEQRGVVREPEIPLYLVTVEWEPPHVVVVWKLDELAKDAGRRRIGTWWNELQASEQTGIWPGYTLTIETFTAEEIDPDEVFAPVTDEDLDNSAPDEGAPDWSA